MLAQLNLKSIWLLFFTLALTACSKSTEPSNTSASTQCNKLSIADMNWSSATLMAHIDQFILQQAFGCSVELVTGDTMPTSTSMAEKAEPDIAPEMWINTSKKILNQAVADKKLVQAGKMLKEGGQEGFWIPQYLLDEYPEMATIEGVIKHAKLFTHPEEKDRSAFYGCPAGWGCQISTNQLFKALNLAQAGFKFVDPGSGAALAGSIAKAYERKQPWFGYYWAPTPVLGKYKMHMVKFGTGYDAKEFARCTTKPNCPDPKVSMYPSAPVYSYTTTKFKQQQPKAFAYIARRSISIADLNSILAWMEDNQADGSTAAVYFLKQYPQIWQSWLNKEGQEKITQAISKL